MASDGMPDRAALGRRGHEISYGELLDRSARVAGWIDARDASTVAQIGVSSDLVPALLFGSAIAGRRFAPLNYRLADDRVAMLVERLAPVLVIADEEVAERVSGFRSGVVGIAQVESEAAETSPLQLPEGAPD